MTERINLKDVGRSVSIRDVSDVANELGMTYEEVINIVQEQGVRALWALWKPGVLWRDLAYSSTHGLLKEEIGVAVTNHYHFTCSVELQEEAVLPSGTVVRVYQNTCCPEGDFLTYDPQGDCAGTELAEVEAYLGRCGITGRFFSYDLTREGDQNW